MSITTYIPYTPTTGQWVAIQKLGVFFESDEFQVFVLKGYAGTGKTTLLKGVLDYLDSIKRPSRLMAYTGRAARVMTQKTGRNASTIHSTIYELDGLKSIVDEKSKTLAFKLRPNPDHPDTIYFIDEASMISDKYEHSQQLLFDDGRFLDHIFRYTGNRKLVFLGDDAQLPPFNSNVIPALSPEYLQKQYKKQVIETALTEVKRQTDAWGIIGNATAIREKLFAGSLPPLGIDKKMGNDIRIENNIWTSVGKYARLIQNQKEELAVLIVLSNGSAHYLNGQVRNRLYKKPDVPLQSGEWLMVIQNNYYTGYNNGQHLRLKSFSDTGEKVGTVSLLDAITVDPHTGKDKEVKIVKELLFRASPYLEPDEEKAFTIDFARRMKKRGIRPKTENFIRSMQMDKRFNALKVKFGYAITCHKAQGGEWENVFLNIEPALMNQSRENQYRWMYTAITRAAKQLVLPKHEIVY
jgi:ATP-dependent exoDNAse (exonuclease V) alpha subunit